MISLLYKIYNIFIGLWKMYELPDTRSKRNGVNSVYCSLFIFLSVFQESFKFCVEKLCGPYAPKAF